MPDLNELFAGFQLAETTQEIVAERAEMLKQAMNRTLETIRDALTDSKV